MKSGHLHLSLTLHVVPACYQRKSVSAPDIDKKEDNSLSVGDRRDRLCALKATTLGPCPIQILACICSGACHQEAEGTGWRIWHRHHRQDNLCEVCARRAQHGQKQSAGAGTGERFL